MKVLLLILPLLLLLLHHNFLLLLDLLLLLLGGRESCCIGPDWVPKRPVAGRTDWDRACASCCIATVPKQCHPIIEHCTPTEIERVQAAALAQVPKHPRADCPLFPWDWTCTSCCIGPSAETSKSWKDRLRLSVCKPHTWASSTKLPREHLWIATPIIGSPCLSQSAKRFHPHLLVRNINTSVTHAISTRLVHNCNTSNLVEGQETTRS